MKKVVSVVVKVLIGTSYSASLRLLNDNILAGRHGNEKNIKKCFLRFC